MNGLQVISDQYSNDRRDMVDFDEWKSRTHLYMKRKAGDNDRTYMQGNNMYVHRALAEIGKKR